MECVYKAKLIKKTRIFHTPLEYSSEMSSAVRRARHFLAGEKKKNQQNKTKKGEKLKF